MEVITDLRALRRALESGITIEKVVCPAGHPYPPALYRLIRRYGLRVQQVPPSALPAKASWGAAYVSPAALHPVEVLLQKPAQGLLLALVGITDVRNAGAIVRSAAAFGVRGVVWPAERAASPSSEALWRSSAGTITRIPLFRTSRLYTDLRRLAEKNWTLVAATPPSPRAIPLPEWSWPPACILLLGSEDRGLPAEYLSLTPHHLTIPHLPTLNSLNVSCATAILLWHYYQQTSK